MRYASCACFCGSLVNLGSVPTRSMPSGQSPMVNGEVPEQLSTGENHQDLMRCPLELINAFEFQLEKCFKLSEDFGSPKKFSVSDGRYLTDSFWHKLLATAPVQPLGHKGTLFNAYISSLNLNKCEDQSSLYLDLPEDEDLAFAFDHHSLITSQLPDAYDEDPIKTADEVIREIDLIMGHDDEVSFNHGDDSPVGEAHPVNCTVLGSNLLPEKELRNLSLDQLNALLEDFEACVREYSAVLVQELAYREELDFEQEQKDVFIARLDEMHRRLERRRRRSSMPPVSRRRTQYEKTPQTAIVNQSEEFTFDSSAGEDPESPISSRATQKQHVPKEATQVLSRAHSAAQAAVAVASSAIRRQWNRLSRGPDELASMEQCMPDRDTITAAPTESSRAITIARLRKWAGRKAAEALNSHTSGSFRALLRRTNRRSEPVKSNMSCMREARSALTSPTSSQTELPSLPTTLTHSASGHLVGHHELSSDDLEYKNLTTTIPYHRSPYHEGPTVEQLQLFNEMLLAILTNNPNLTPMLTDYILNVYAPADRRPSKLPI
ncbi:hypothetical protein D915_002895 [Fasciola hepatica]|uniref:Fasciculation and elongation protein zeta-2 n=1 Tax=Fasciola hepatica TaxID=6192 RepID=A0A4E0RF16_FASHE|nr:hypothetical protein D915_002895 [Fasciola hepatica]